MVDASGAPAASTAAVRSSSEGWVGIAANPASGRGRVGITVARLERSLAKRGIETRTAWSIDERRSILDASRETGGCLCLVAAGGDGTVSDLVNEAPSAPIAVIPAGTENLFACQFGFDRDMDRLADAIVAGRSRPLDLGNLEGRRFALMAGFGFDAEVVGRHHAARIRRTGSARPTHRGEYVEPVLRASFTYRFPELRLILDGDETITGTTAFVFNLPRYALRLPFAPLADGEDGLLDVVVFRDGGAFHALRYLWLVFRGLHTGRDGVEHRRVRRIDISAGERVPIQLDGDPAKPLLPGVESGATIVVEPASIEVLVMPDALGKMRRFSESSPVRAGIGDVEPVERSPR
ncbi:MAG: diacylglycerol kinase family protein [Isosphaeraceae bacterium]|nr:diacylglycerol kinase family protein [Isosphaeraceae bacterium]